MASSLHYLSLTPKTLSLTKPNTTITTTTTAAFPSFSFPSSSFKLSISTSSARHFIRNVAVSEFDQVVETEDDVADAVSDDNSFDSVEEEKSFSPDLKLFVGNLPFNVDSATLAGLFERAGNVEMVEVIYDKETGRSRGFGFVTMSSAEEVAAAEQQFNGYELEGRQLRVNSGPAPPKRERENSFRGGNSSFGGSRGGGSFDNSNRVYVGNLSWGVDENALETLFREQGRVVDAKVVYDRESGRSRGFGFVTYSSAQEVNSAIEALDGAELDGRSIRVSPAEARQRREF